MVQIHTIDTHILYTGVNRMDQLIYIRMRHRIQVRPHDTVILKDIALIHAPERIHSQLEQLFIHEVSSRDQNFIVIDAMKVIELITGARPELEVQTLGPAQTIIEVIPVKKKVKLPIFLFIWFLLFFGSALAIMNFHEDVSMRAVQEKLYTIITGKETKKPLLFQIPYSLGIGLGMILFFNHLFQKRINDEPSPLEVEMFNYQQDLDQYVIMHENDESVKELHDH